MTYARNIDELVQYLNETGMPIVYFTQINYGYIDYARNFMSSYHKSGCSFTLVVFCLDKETHDAMSKIDGCYCVMSSDFIDISECTSEFSVWLEMKYKKLMFSKFQLTELIWKTSSRLTAKAILYIDTDIILLKDPTPTFIKAFDDHPEKIVIAQCDENSSECTGLDTCSCMCFGVIAFRSNTYIKGLFDFCENDIIDNYSDQHFGNKQLGLHNVPRMTLSKNVLLNGVYGSVRTGVYCTLPESAVMLHFNWMIGNDKKRRMKEQNMWYIE